MKTLHLVLLAAVAFLAACSTLSQPLADPSTTAAQDQGLMGLLKVTIEGTEDGGTPSATAELVDPAMVGIQGLRSQSARVVPFGQFGPGSVIQTPL